MSWFVVMLGGCLWTGAEEAGQSGVKGVASCDAEDSRDDRGDPVATHLTTRCLEDDCEVLRVELSPSQGLVSWFIDGVSVGDAACNVDVRLGEGEHIQLSAKAGEDELYTQSMASLSDAALDGGDENQGGPQPNVVIYGPGEGCNFYIVMLGGCLKAQSVGFRRSLSVMGSQSSTTEYVLFSPQTSPRMVTNSAPYADWMRWTPALGNIDLGHRPIGYPMPPESLGGSDPFFSHGFQLVHGDIADLDVNHGGQWESLDTFWCLGNTGGVGEPGSGI